NGLCVPGTGSRAQYSHSSPGGGINSCCREYNETICPASPPSARSVVPGKNPSSGALVMKPMLFGLNALLWRSGIILACLAATPAKAPAQAAAADQVPDGPTKLLRFADISKDKVVFAYAGDLWISSRDGGAARRLTSHVGD